MHRGVVRRLCFYDFAQRKTDCGRPLLLQKIERVDDIGGCDRRAIGKLRVLAQLEGHGHAVGRNVDRLGDEAVHRVRLILRTHHQAVEQKVGSCRGVTLDDVGVERIVGRRAVGD